MLLLMSPLIYNQTEAALRAFLQIITSIIVASSLFIGLLFVDTFVSLSAAVLFVGAYSSLAYISRRELSYQRS